MWCMPVIWHLWGYET